MKWSPIEHPFNSGDYSFGPDNYVITKAVHNALELEELYQIIDYVKDLKGVDFMQAFENKELGETIYCVANLSESEKREYVEDKIYTRDEIKQKSYYTIMFDYEFTE